MKTYRIKQTTGHHYTITPKITQKTTLFDLRGTKWCATPTLNFQITLTNHDNASVCGHILCDQPPKLAFLFCQNPLAADKVDDDYAQELTAIQPNYDWALINFDELLTKKNHLNPL